MRQGQLSRTARRRKSIFRKPPAPPALKGEGTEPSILTTALDAKRLRSKSAAASDRPGSEREQPSMKVVTVNFERSKGEWMGIRSVFLWGFDFPVMSRRVARRVSSSNLDCTGREASCCRGNCLQGGEGPVHRRRVLGSTK